jgi:CheY-like chemotaxis protein
LAFSRRQPLQPVSTDVNHLLDEMLDLLVRSLGETIRIELAPAAGLWQCEVDPGQLENTVLNLSINARDAMPDGGRLTIETSNTRIDAAYAAEHREVAPGEYVLLAVSDNGTGMEPEVRSRIFDPFFTTKDVGKGTGLGLSMVFGFVKQSGGHVSVHSEPGHGTTMRLFLPRSPVLPVAPCTAVAANGGQGPQGETVLLVEDDAGLLDLVTDMLENLGYTVLAAGNAQAALAALATAPKVDLLLTDVVLPDGMSGPALVAAIHQERTDLKVVYMSGYTQDAIVHQGRLDPGVELLSKPFTMENLGKKLRDLLDGDS